MRERWLRVGLLALGIVALNATSRLVTWRLDIEDASRQETIGLVGAGAVAVLLAGAAAWWAYRFPFVRLVFDLGAAVAVGALLSLLVGPFAGGSRPLAEGLGTFVGELLMFLGVAAIAVTFGFLGVVSFGQDWKSRGLRAYQQTYERRPHRTVRG